MSLSSNFKVNFFVALPDKSLQQFTPAPRRQFFLLSPWRVSCPFVHVADLSFIYMLYYYCCHCFSSIRTISEPESRGMGHEWWGHSDEFLSGFQIEVARRVGVVVVGMTFRDYEFC